VIPDRRIALVTLGCARNEVDSEEMLGRLEADGWSVVEDAGDADLVVVNTCGFIEAARKDSVDTILDLAGEGRPVVAVGCMAERYGVELAAALPEAAAVLGFDDYASIADRLEGVLEGRSHPAHTPRDRRLLLPLTPVARGDGEAPPGHSTVRHRIETGPVASVKLASGCDRRCSFCAIPSFRGAFVSRAPDEILAEVDHLAAHGVREVVLVSENSTSYGKDLGDLRLLESLLPRLGALVPRVRVAYLQPAEMRPGLVSVLGSTPGVAPYADLSFQHASPTVLRRMRRFGGTEPFLDLLEQLRRQNPAIGVRSNVIVGFPGESEADLAELEAFLTAARLDAVGVFGYSDEAGTEAVSLDGHLPPHEVRRRVERVSALVDELCVQRAEDRLGEDVDVLVLAPQEGRSAHQGPEDFATRLEGSGLPATYPIGAIVPARVVGCDGADLLAVPT
jgi:ribosomal protein S12 methylthiotransferase